MPGGGFVSAQQQFDNNYVTSIEVCATLGIHRTSVLLAIRTDRLPEPIKINRPNGTPLVLVWERDVIAPYLADWSKARAERAAQ